MSQSEQSPLDKHAGAYIAKMGDLVVDSIWSTCVGQCINPLCNLDGTQADKHCERLYISRERFDQHIAPKLRELVAIEHRLHIAHLSAASSSDAPLVTIREDVARFLLGEGPLEGVWWGEMNHKRDALFWWRNPLRVSMHPFALSSARSSVTPTKECPNCNGAGSEIDGEPCDTCNGTGAVMNDASESHASSNDRCFDAAFKALEHLDSVRFMWNGPIHQAVALLRAATGPQSARRCEKCGCSWDAPVEACPACGFVPSKRVTDDMVNRFLSWPLPDSVCTDLCTTKANTYPNRIGTNLLTAYEARKMLEHVLETPIAASATRRSDE